MEVLKVNGPLEYDSDDSGHFTNFVKNKSLGKKSKKLQIISDDELSSDENNTLQHSVLSVEHKIDLKDSEKNDYLIVSPNKNSVNKKKRKRINVSSDDESGDPLVFKEIECATKLENKENELVDVPKNSLYKKKKRNLINSSDEEPLSSLAKTDENNTKEKSSKLTKNYFISNGTITDENASCKKKKVTKSKKVASKLNSTENGEEPKKSTKTRKLKSLTSDNAKEIDTKKQTKRSRKKALASDNGNNEMTLESGTERPSKKKSTKKTKNSKSINDNLGSEHPEVNNILNDEGTSTFSKKKKNIASDSESDDSYISEESLSELLQEKDDLERALTHPISDTIESNLFKEFFEEMQQDENESNNEDEKSNSVQKKRRCKANKELLEVRSKTCQMLRESRLTLPYYCPPKYNLETFLKERCNKNQSTIKLSCVPSSHETIASTDTNITMESSIDVVPTETSDTTLKWKSANVPNSDETITSTNTNTTIETSIDVIPTDTINDTTLKRKIPIPPSNFVPKLKEDFELIILDPGSDDSMGMLQKFKQKFINEVKIENEDPKLEEKGKTSVNGKKKKNVETPGAKLIALRNELMTEILKKKEIAFEKRKQLEKLDNENVSDYEEILEDGDVEGVLSDSDDDAMEDDDDDAMEDEDDDEQLQEEEKMKTEAEKFCNLEADVDDDDDLKSQSSDEDDNELIIDEGYNQPEPANSNTKHDGDSKHDNSQKSDLFNRSQPIVTSFEQSNSEIRPNLQELEPSKSLLDTEFQFKGYDSSQFSLSAIPPYQPGGGFQNVSQEVEPSQASDAAISQPFNVNFTFESDAQSQPVASNLSGFKFSNDLSQNVPDVEGMCSGRFSDSSMEAWTPSNSPMLNNEKLTFSRKFSQSMGSRKKKVRAILSSDEECSDNEGQAPKLNHTENYLKKALDLVSCGLMQTNNENSEADDIEQDDEKNIEVNYNDEDDLDTEKQIEQVKDFFDEEAELSGEEESPDEDEDINIDVSDMLSDNNIPSEDKLRDQIGKMHFKHLMDDDNKMVRLIKDHLLEDGDLYTDSAGRQRKFQWRNSDGLLDNADAQDGEESEGEAEIEIANSLNQEKIKWRHEQDIDDNEILPLDISLTSFESRKSELKLDIVGKKGQTTFSGEEQKTKITKRPRGSLLTLEQNQISNTLKKLKGPECESSGSRTTKHFVFRNAEEIKVPEVKTKKVKSLVPHIANIPGPSVKRLSIFDQF